MTTAYCPVCGHQEGTHETCGPRLQWEPPRYCTVCGRRMVVQVRPDGWSARCSEHGRTDSAEHRGRQ